MYTIGIEQTFSGAHRLRKYRGSCERLHGHNWTVRVNCAGDILGDNGLLMDFRSLKKKLHGVLKQLDHSYLNERPSFKKQEPTAENIARFIFDAMQKLLARSSARVSSVRVWESENCWAEYDRLQDTI